MKYLAIFSLLTITNAIAQDFLISAVGHKKTQYPGVFIIKEKDPLKHVTLDCQGFIHEIRVLNKKKDILFYRPVSEIECLSLQQNFLKADKKKPVCIIYKQAPDRFYKADC